MKVLEYNLVSTVIDTSKMMQVDDFSTKVIVGLTKDDYEYICKRIGEALEFDVLRDVVKKLNLIIRLYVNRQYIISYPNNKKNNVHVNFNVETKEDILGHMYETDDESIVTTWLDLRNKRQEIIYAPVIKQENNHPRTPKRKYRMVGKSTKTTIPSDSPESSSPPWIAYVFATIVVIGFVLLLFAGLGVAVFLLPLLAGAFTKK